MKLKIEKGIPMTGPNRYGEVSSLIAKMEVGDSFLYEKSKRVGLCTIFQRHRMKCATRVVEGDPQTIRVWRIK